MCSRNKELRREKRYEERVARLPNWARRMLAKGRGKVYKIRGSSQLPALQS